MLVNRFLLLTTVLATASCATLSASPTKKNDQERGTEGQVLSKKCARASIAVKPEKGSFQYGVDPVETQRAVLLSRRFRAAAAKAESALLGVRFKVRRVGPSAILELVATGGSSDEAMKSCAALLRTALTQSDASRLGDETAKKWLAEQRQVLGRQAQKAEQVLQDFRKANNLLVLDLRARMEMARRRLVALREAEQKAKGKKRREDLAQAAASTRDQILSLNRLEVEHARLKRSADNARRLADAIGERQMKLRLDQLLDQRILLLDACAAASCY